MSSSQALRVLSAPTEAVQWLAPRLQGSGTLQTDSRKVRPGDAFIAWPGGATDGRAHVASALERGRSEEHTSEPQSPCNLVCRLLLEKKKSTVPTNAVFVSRTSTAGFFLLLSMGQTLILPPFAPIRHDSARLAPSTPWPVVCGSLPSP